MYFLRDKQGHELDAVIESGQGQLTGIEIKSGATIASDFFNGLDYWRTRLSPATLDPWMIYGGDEEQIRQRGHVIPWSELQALLSKLTTLVC